MSLAMAHLRIDDDNKRGVAQPGRALRSGRRGRRFKSCRPDFGPSQNQRVEKRKSSSRGQSLRLLPTHRFRITLHRLFSTRSTVYCSTLPRGQNEDHRDFRNRLQHPFFGAAACTVGKFRSRQAHEVQLGRREGITPIDSSHPENKIQQN